jgi:hypothetical protein
MFEYVEDNAGFRTDKKARINISNPHIEDMLKCLKILDTAINKQTLRLKSCYGIYSFLLPFRCAMPCQISAVPLND